MEVTPSFRVKGMKTFSRNTRNGCWNAFKLLLTEEGCMWTSLLPSYQTGWPFFAGLLDCLRLLSAAAAMPCSVAATLGYKPAHKIACQSVLRIHLKPEQILQKFRFILEAKEDMKKHSVVSLCWGRYLDFWSIRISETRKKYDAVTTTEPHFHFCSVNLIEVNLPVAWT